MANASVRFLTQGWSGEQRRALMRELTEDQRRVVRARIESERLAKKFESGEAVDATRFLDSLGEHGHSCGIPEYVAAVSFGRDDAFREMWQRIRHMTD